MKQTPPHTFHIPVMGLGYTIDTPVKVGRFGISSVVSIIEDELIEQMREFYSRKYNYPYEFISKTAPDHRARRITAYLDLLNDVLNKQMDALRNEEFVAGSDLVKYFELLDDRSPLKKEFIRMTETTDPSTKRKLQLELKEKILAGKIDVNIMTKCDRQNTDAEGNALPAEYSDALSALRGFAKSTLRSSVIFSAGLNPRLYSYCEGFDCFYPDENGNQEKKIVIKVSDYRSALIQGKFLAKKGLWVSEFRIESGLNCGGHAFPTEGLLLGPILQEFHDKLEELRAELFSMCNKALIDKKKTPYASAPEVDVTVQGGIGTAAEDRFLLEHYHVSGTGWGSPFLLVPEATNVDEKTLDAMANAKPADYYTSYASPLGIAFNNFRGSSSEVQRKTRIDKEKPGSPCKKKYLAFSTEFEGEALCLASRKYQDLKIKKLKASNLPEQELEKEIESVMEKDCLCEGLGAAALLKNNINKPGQLTAVAICPGPNLAYFSGKFTLEEMVGHIYGRVNLLNKVPRYNMFINELKLYFNFLVNKLSTEKESTATSSYIDSFRKNLLQGIEYYDKLFPSVNWESDTQKKENVSMLHYLKGAIESLVVTV